MITAVRITWMLINILLFAYTSYYSNLMTIGSFLFKAQKVKNNDNFKILETFTEPILCLDHEMISIEYANKYFYDLLTTNPKNYPILTVLEKLRTNLIFIGSHLQQDLPLLEALKIL